MARTNWSPAIAACTLLALSGGALLWANGESEHEKPRKAPEKLPAPVVSIHDLMHLFNEPYFEELKETMKAEPTEKGQWGKIEDLGYKGAEIVNLAAMREMKEEHKKKWPGLVRTAQQAALDLAHAAKSKDYAKTRAAYENLVKNCNDCHQQTEPDHAPLLKP